MARAAGRNAVLRARREKAPECREENENNDATLERYAAQARISERIQRVMNKAHAIRRGAAAL